MFLFGKINKIKIFLLLFVLLFPFGLKADVLNQKINFFIDSDYDVKKREKIEATLFEISKYGYFYVETNWYQNLTEGEKEEVKENLKTLSKEFDQNIYPTLTSTFGKEWSPGIDDDERVTILFHQMKKGVGGYFNNGNEYLKIQNPRSNEREMVYLNCKDLTSPLIESHLAHEFLHLITFNQKDRLRGVSEDVWLNEARAEYAPTLIGYDKEYKGSNLQQRVRNFLEHPHDSLIEWKNEKSDYGVINLFTQYLVDHYGIDILVDSLHSKKTGIDSINFALEKNNFKEDFGQIFTNWLIALYLQDCSLGEKFCYKNENLKDLKIIPTLIFLPTTQKTELSLNYSIKDWSGYWYKIFGGEGNLRIIFDGEDKAKFSLAYVLCKETKKCEVDYLNLDENQRGELFFENFPNNWENLTLIISSQTRTSNPAEKELFHSFSLSVSAQIQKSVSKEELIKEIERLKREISEIKRKIEEILNKRAFEIPKDFTFRKNLYYGIKSEDVIYLKEILAKENCISGINFTQWFGPKTKKGVQCLCQKYKKEISQYAGYEVRCTGFVGRGIKKKLNELISSK